MSTSNILNKEVYTVMDRIKARSWAEININNLRHNALVLKGLLKDDCQMMCAIKANAYGHGMLKAAEVYDSIADQFAVACLDEAVELRNAGFTKESLILGYTPVEYAKELIDINVMQTVYSYEYAKQLDTEVDSYGKKLKVHLKIDSGMSRLGFSVKDTECLDKTFNEISSLVKECKNLEFKGLFTHFHSSDHKTSEKTDIQFERYLKLKSMLDDAGIKFEFYHCCNSAAMIRYPRMHMNMVRPGITLYGAFPGETERDIDIRPTFELKTRVGQIHRVKAGEGISYNTTFIADKDMTVATVPIGYADGYPRHLTNKGIMLVNGQRVRVVGNICMDQCVIDVTGVDVKEGDVVTVFGKDGNEYISVDEVSENAGTIPNELLCLFSERVRRVYIEE